MFVGRNAELNRLERLYHTESFQMVVVYGRRRVGKTALVGEFGRDKRTLYFTALDQADKDNLSDFSRAVYSFFGIPGATGPFATWSDAFGFISDKARAGRFVLVFDEFPYAALRNRALPSILQVAVDHGLKQTGLFLVLCGSNQGFMESEVLGRKSPLYGRRTAQMKVPPLSYRDSALMLPGLDAQDCFRYYGCFGGVPYYLEQIDVGRSLQENLAELYFDTTGFLFDEPYGLLRQEFKEPAIYASVLRAIAGGSNRQSLVADRLGVEQTTLPKYLKALSNLGIVEKVVPFGESPERSKRGIYRMADACYDFWYRFVMPRASDVEQGMGHLLAERVMGRPLADYLGHRFERLCAEWLAEQARAGLLPIAATRVGSWWGTDPALREQTDIDVLAADPDAHTLLVGECKYRETFDETAAIAKLEGKRGLVRGYEAVNLALFTKRPVSEATKAKHKEDGNLAFVTLDEMYAR